MTADRERELEQRLGLPRVVWYDKIGSTLDVAHSLAEQGAPAGTLVLAVAQTAGRGRLGRTWRSEAGAGVWMTLIERPSDAAALDVLPLRAGLALAESLEHFADAPARVKWPNDVYVAGKKVAGILVEARWREAVPIWIAIGVGINLRPPNTEPRAGGLKAHATIDAVLGRAVPALRAAAGQVGLLAAAELDRLSARDYAAGRECTHPVAGRVRGIDASGALLIDTNDSTVAVRAGSLLLTEDL
jgi:BirA family biotin operon repressor/biotin-[acetyl-CoA-carboxylase] ligase